MYKYLLWFPVVVLLCCLTGCGDKLVEVTGKVTYNGAVVDKPGGVIIFVSDEGKQVKADIGANGEYRASTVPVGHNRVVAYYANPAARTGKLLPKPGESPPSEPPPSVFLTPMKYVKVETSGLAVDVQSGTVFSVEMSGPAIP